MDLSNFYNRFSSSNVGAFKWVSGTLTVEFHSGAQYNYYGVPEDVAESFVNAPSKGKFVWRALRDQYDYERIL